MFNELLLQMMEGCYIWDIAGGDSFSIFLVDRAGFQPEVHYVGKHPTYVFTGNNSPC